jgi:hypothetical protein
MTGGREETIPGANNRNTALDRHNLNASDDAAMFKIRTFHSFTKTKHRLLK